MRVDDTSGEDSLVRRSGGSVGDGWQWCPQRLVAVPLDDETSVTGAQGITSGRLFMECWHLLFWRLSSFCSSGLW